MDVCRPSTLITSTLRNRFVLIVNYSVNFFQVISCMPLNEMQLDMLAWLLTLFFLHFCTRNQANCPVKARFMRQALTQNTEEAGRNAKVAKVWFYWVKFQLTSVRLSAPYTFSKALHGPDIAISMQLLHTFHKVSRLCHVTDAPPTDNYIPIYINPLQSTYRWRIDPIYSRFTYNLLSRELDQVQSGSI